MAGGEFAKSFCPLSAISLLWDRARGKVVQPIGGEGGSPLFVITGVPEPDGKRNEKVIEHQLTPEFKPEARPMPALPPFTPHEFRVSPAGRTRAARPRPGTG